MDMRKYNLSSGYWDSKKHSCLFCDEYTFVDDNEDILKNTLWRHLYAKHDWVHVAQPFWKRIPATGVQLCDEDGYALQCWICHKVIEEASVDYRSEFRLLAHILELSPEERDEHVMAMLMQ